jgi:hypothetical protein
MERGGPARVGDPGVAGSQGEDGGHGGGESSNVGAMQRPLLGWRKNCALSCALGGVLCAKRCDVGGLTAQV